MQNQVPSTMNVRSPPGRTPRRAIRAKLSAYRRKVTRSGHECCRDERQMAVSAND
jgi:hypothetical protein